MQMSLTCPGHTKEIVKCVEQRRQFPLAVGSFCETKPPGQIFTLAENIPLIYLLLFMIQQCCKFSHPNSVILKQSLKFPHYPGANYPFHPLVFPNLFGPGVNPMTCALEVALKKSYAYNFLFRNGQNEPMGMHPQTSHGQSNCQALMTVFFETTLFAYWK